MMNSWNVQEKGSLIVAGEVPNSLEDSEVVAEDGPGGGAH